MVLGALYLVAIARLSPHRLPGLQAFALVVFFVGLSTPLAGTRFRRVELALRIIALLFGALAFLDIAYVSYVAMKH